MFLAPSWSMINDSYQKISDDRLLKCNDSSGMIGDSFRRVKLFQAITFWCFNSIIQTRYSWTKKNRSLSIYFVTFFPKTCCIEKMLSVFTTLSLIKASIWAIWLIFMLLKLKYGVTLAGYKKKEVTLAVKKVNFLYPNQ